MGDNRKILIEIVTKTSGAEKKIKGVGNAADGAGKKAEGASKSFFGLGKTMKAIARGFIIVKSFQLLAQAITESIKIVAEFELTMNKVKAITGATEKEFAKLTTSAKELALGTMFTASQVGELQLAYSKLGFTTQEIEAASEATLRLATITGDDLGSAADVVGATIRGFGLDAGEATRVVDVMSKSFTSSALNLETFKQSMKTVAPIANAANIDLETTTALLGTLADRGIRGTVAATGLKNIFMALSDPTSELANFLGYTVEGSSAAMAAFKDLGEEGINLAVAQGLITKRAAAAFLTLADGVEDVEKLREALDSATGSSIEMADIIEDSLTIKWQKFGSAIQNYVLNTLEDTGELLGDVLEVLTEFVNDQDRAVKVLKAESDIYKELNESLDNHKSVVRETQVPFSKLINLHTENNNALTENRAKLVELRKSYEPLNKVVMSYNNAGKLAPKQINDQAIELLNLIDKLEIENTEREEIAEKIKNERDERLAILKIDSVKFYSEEIKTIKGLLPFLDEKSETYSDLTVVLKAYEDQLKSVQGSQKGEISGVGGEAAAKKAKKDHDKRIKAEIKLEKLKAEQIIDSAEMVKFHKIAALAFELDKIKELNEYKDASRPEQLAMEEDVRNKIFQLDKKYGELLIKENEKNNDILDKEREKVATEIENWEAEMLQMRIDAGVQLMQAGFDMYQVLANNRMEAMARENEAEMAAFTDLQDEKLSRFDIDQQHEKDSFIGTQQQKADFERQKGLERLEFEKQQQEAREALIKKQLKAENAAAKEAFRVEKANTIAKIAIQTALGIAQINANPTVNADPTLFSLRTLMSKLILGTGAAQVAVVGAQKFQPKTFQDGGMIEGASHSEGGVPFTVAGRAGFEAEGGEYIFSRNTVDRLGTGLLDAINFGGAAPRLFADGGAVSRASVASSAMNQAEMAQMIGEVVASSVTQIPVVNVATETDSLSRMVQNAEAMATI
jgi:TP901 family phage tail tape measure protein